VSESGLAKTRNNLVIFETALWWLFGYSFSVFPIVVNNSTRRKDYLQGQLGKKCGRPNSFLSGNVETCKIQVSFGETTPCSFKSSGKISTGGLSGPHSPGLLFVPSVSFFILKIVRWGV
jgi:hypothetical protein